MTPKEQRHAALSPLIEELDLHAGSAKEVPACIRVGGQEVDLGVWEQSVLRQARSTPNADTERGMALLTECMAFQARFKMLMTHFEAGPMPAQEEMPAFLDRLVTDVAVGLALQKELEREVSSLIKAGQLSPARNLAAFRKKIVGYGGDLKQRVGQGTFEQARRKVSSLITVDQPLRPPARAPKRPPMVDPAAASRPAVKEVKEKDPKPKAPSAPAAKHDWQQACRDAMYQPGVPVPEVEEPEERKDRTKPLIGALVALVVIWAVFIFPRLGSDTPPVLKHDQFRQFTQVSGVTAHPPSLFVKLEARAWASLDETAKRRLLGDIARIADAEGYVGLHAMTTDGAAVGQWLKKTGVRLLVSTAGAS